ncbi:hypothetical protein B7486_59365 [cyanobacterium TDX16]|nr:hypothetical protein B7486_59365 [cyanobacterium TDX16]
MSLWTPGGEHPVDRERGEEPERPLPPDAPDLESLTPEQRAEAEAMAAEMAEAQRQIAEVPASVVINNHLMGFYELAAIHLSQQPPNLAEGKVAITAMASVLGNLEGQLGEDEPALRNALQQIQLAFVELTRRATEGEPAADDGPSEA